MNKEQSNVKQWMQTFGQDCPTKPCIPSFEVRRLKAKLILEEALETINKGLCIGIEISTNGEDNWILLNDLDINKHMQFCSYGHGDLVELADGLADLKYVTDGTAIACGLDMEPIEAEVHRSNMSKLWTDIEMQVPKSLPHPCNANITYIRSDDDLDRDFENQDKVWIVKSIDGKVIKSPSYSPANIQPIIDAQIL